MQNKTQDTGNMPGDVSTVTDSTEQKREMPTFSTEVSLENLLKAGAHYGHKVSRWNPKMAPYIFTVRNRFHIIDLEKTLQKIREAQAEVIDVVRSGGTVLFVGTKRQGKNIVKKHAMDAGMPYVIERWLGGTLTNFKTIQRSIRKMSELENLLGSEKVKNYTKKERLMMEREFAKSKMLFEGIRDMKKLPEMIFVNDTLEEIIAVREAVGTGVKVIGITDTNADPSMIDFPIPANDDATSTIEIVCKAISDAVVKGTTSVPASESKPVKK